MSKSALECMNSAKKYYIDEGYNITFTKPVVLSIWLKRSNVFGEGYSEWRMQRVGPEHEEEETNEEEEEEEEEEKEQINTDYHLNRMSV